MSLLTLVSQAAQATPKQAPLSNYFNNVNGPAMALVFLGGIGVFLLTRYLKKAGALVTLLLYVAIIVIVVVVGEPGLHAMHLIVFDFFRYVGDWISIHVH